MKPRTLALALFALLLVVPQSAMPQTGSFIIAQHGKSVGTATVTFSADPKGYDTTSVVRVAMQGLNYNFSKTERLSPANHLRHVQLSATVNNSAVNLTAAPDAAQILLNISANGRSTTTRLASHPGAVFLPDFDPGAFDTLLALAVTQNNRGLWAILPKKSGAQNGSIVPVQLATYADLEGTLDGKPVTVHHLEATIGEAKSELFSGPTNQLLQAELPQQGFAIVRKGFVLTPPAKPGAPPVSPGATPQSAPQPALQAQPAPLPAPVQQ
jgi:hypothetical protein